MAAKLPSDAGRNALSALLRIVERKGGSVMGVLGEIDACCEGVRGDRHKPTMAQLDESLSDYATNGFSNGQWNAAHFRACIARTIDSANRAAIPPTPAGARPERQSIGARAFATARDAIKDL